MGSRQPVRDPCRPFTEFLAFPWVSCAVFPCRGSGGFVPLLLWSWRLLNCYPLLTCPLEKEEGGLGCYGALTPVASLCGTPLFTLFAPLSAQRLPTSDLFLTLTLTPLFTFIICSFFWLGLNVGPHTHRANTTTEFAHISCFYGLKNTLSVFPSHEDSLSQGRKPVPLPEPDNAFSRRSWALLVSAACQLSNRNP